MEPFGGELEVEAHKTLRDIFAPGTWRIDGCRERKSVNHDKILADIEASGKDSAFAAAVYIKAVQVQPTWEPSAVGYLRPEPTIYNCPVYLTTRAAASDAPFRRRNETLRLLGSAARPSCSWRRSRRTCPRRSGCSAEWHSSPSSINELQRAPTALPAPTARALAALGVTRVPAITDSRLRARPARGDLLLRLQVRVAAGHHGPDVAVGEGHLLAVAVEEVEVDVGRPIRARLRPSGSETPADGAGRHRQTHRIRWVDIIGGRGVGL